MVLLELKESGVTAFSEATGRLAGTNTPISIWMDENVISYPTVSTQITDGSASITGNFTLESATDLANKINGGALPFKLETENFRSISATLGMGAKDAMVLGRRNRFCFGCSVCYRFLPTARAQSQRLLCWGNWWVPLQRLPDFSPLSPALR